MIPRYDKPTWVACCPVCGDPSDYCLGHGEIGDPVGFAILHNHDLEQHYRCHINSDCRM